MCYLCTVPHKVNIMKVMRVYACVFCVMSNSHQCEPPRLSSAVWLRERIQPSMWLHLCPHLRVSPVETLCRTYADCSSASASLHYDFSSLSFTPCPESPTKPRCSVSSRQTWVASSLALWSTRSSPPAWRSSTATWPRLLNPSKTSDTKS